MVIKKIIINYLNNMLTKEQIEERNFKFQYSSDLSFSNDGSRDVYIADRKTKNKVNTDITYIPCLLEYYESGLLKITDYFDDPTKYKEYYFIGKVTTEQQLDDVLDTLKFTIENYKE